MKPLIRQAHWRFVASLVLGLTCHPLGAAVVDNGAPLPVATVAVERKDAGSRLNRPATIPGRYIIETWQTEQGLPQNTVTSMAQTRDGYLWVGTLNGLARFDGVRFKVVSAANTPELGSARIRFLFGEREGGALDLLTERRGGPTPGGAVHQGGSA